MLVFMLSFIPPLVLHHAFHGAFLMCWMSLLTQPTVAKHWRELTAMTSSQEVSPTIVANMGIIGKPNDKILHYYCACAKQKVYEILGICQFSVCLNRISPNIVGWFSCNLRKRFALVGNNQLGFWGGPKCWGFHAVSDFTSMTSTETTEDVV